MKILVVEDDMSYKRQSLEEFLNARNIDFHVSRSVNPALKYVIGHLTEINGIILDLGLTTYDDSNDYNLERGLDFVKELTRKRINIPILINSSTYINLSDIMEHHHNVKGQRFDLCDYQTLEWFIDLLKK